MTNAWVERMLLLVTDTSGKNGFVGLARAEEGQSDKVELIDEVPLAGGTFSAQLVPQIAGLLEKHKLRKIQIDAFIVISGPGSFTGLRVGLAAIKALAEILNKPIVPVSLLAVISLAAGSQGKVLAVLDAGRGEVFAGEYEVGNQSAELLREQVLPKTELLSFLRQGFVLATPDAALASTLEENGLSLIMTQRGSTEAIARLGWQKLHAGNTVRTEQLEANYVRRSDSEIFAKTSS